MRILVTGASGFVGGAVCRELLARGHEVRATVRRPTARPSATPGMREVLVPDLAVDFDRRELVQDIDAIVHLAAIAHRSAREAEIRRVNVDAAGHLAEAAAGRVRRFVFMSSIKVHGEDSGDSAFSETTPTQPEDAYGRSKLEAEILLTDLAARSGMELTLIRAPLVYGPGVKGNFLRLLRAVDSGLPLPFAGVRNQRSLIYIGNLVDAVAGAVEHAEGRGAFLVSDDQAASTPELVSGLARALGRPARLFAVPIVALRLAAAVVGRGEEIRRLTGNLVADASRARRVLNWHPRHTLDDGLRETVAWFKASHG